MPTLPVPATLAARLPSIRRALPAAIAACLLAAPLAAPPAWANTSTAPVAARALPDFTALVDSQSPAVVNISTTRSATPANNAQVDPNELPEFLRRFAPFGFNAPPQRGQGSGFILSADGYLLTNAHVVADATEVIVRLTDRREFKAKVVGADRRSDVAVLKIDAQNLPTVRVGDAGKLRVGEWVAAIGSPFGFESTVTAGIVSAKSRSLPDDSIVPFIQTDVAINPGNSGGPLFNLQGEVVGINSQIYSRSGGYQGLSFAIPIDVAIKVKDDLVTHGRVQRGRIGVAIQPMTKELAESFGLDKPTGALVNSVDAGGPADKGGVRTGDVIVAVDGKPIEQSVDLPRIIGDARPGQSLRLSVIRKGERRDLTVAAGEFPAERVAQAATPGKPAANPGRLGVAVRPLNNDERKRVDGGAGVVVEQADGAAARAGIRAGDIIIAFNDQPVTSAQQLKDLVDNARDRAAVLVQREGNRRYVPLRLG